MTAEDVKRFLKLEPHPREGGWFVRSYASAALVPASVLASTADPVRYEGPRRLATAIYYLLEPNTFSEMHRLRSDEVFHHYAGGPVEMLQLFADGRSERVVLGKDLEAGQRPQILVPKGIWQGSRMLPGSCETWSLLGCTVSPGFEYQDYERGTCAELQSRWPAATRLIHALVREGCH